MKKLMPALAGIALLLTLILSVHIYIVTRTPKADEHTIAMARIDIHQNINEADAGKIGAWLYSQQGVKYVLCNEQTQIVVFSFMPVKTSADDIVARFRVELNFPNAVRFKPNNEEMQKGCPVLASGSFADKLTSFFKHI